VAGYELVPTSYATIPFQEHFQMLNCILSQAGKDFIFGKQPEKRMSLNSCTIDLSRERLQP